MNRMSTQTSIDVRGKSISTYILYVASKNMRDIQEGEVLEIISDKNEAIENDIKAWCKSIGHVLETIESVNQSQRFYLQKKTVKTKTGSFAIIISNPGLEDLLTPLSLALGSALNGDDVHLIFQGPAVNVLKKGFKGSLSGFGKFFSSFARKGMADIGHLPPQEKLRQLKELGARFYICGGSMEQFKVKKNELIFDDIVVGEYMTFLEVMHRADTRFFLQ